MSKETDDPAAAVLLAADALESEWCTCPRCQPPPQQSPTPPAAERGEEREFCFWACLEYVKRRPVILECEGVSADIKSRNLDSLCRAFGIPRPPTAPDPLAVVKLKEWATDSRDCNQADMEASVPDEHHEIRQSFFKGYIEAMDEVIEKLDTLSSQRVRVVEGVVLGFPDGNMRTPAIGVKDEIGPVGTPVKVLIEEVDE